MGYIGTELSVNLISEIKGFRSAIYSPKKGIKQFLILNTSRTSLERLEEENDHLRGKINVVDMLETPLYSFLCSFFFFGWVVGRKGTSYINFR